MKSYCLRPDLVFNFLRREKHSSNILISYVNLLLSRGSMKRAIMNINFKDDIASVSNLEELAVTKDGHYPMP